MVFRSRVLAFIFLFVCCVAKAADVSMEGRQERPFALPYQPVVVRQTIRNTGNEVCRVRALEAQIMLGEIGGPGLLQTREVRNQTVIAGPDSDDIPLGTNRLTSRGQQPLQTNHEMSFTCVLAGEWRDGEFLKPLFPLPGNYSIRFRSFEEAIQRPPFLTDEIKIQVRRPVGEDLIIVAILNENSRLVKALFSLGPLVGDDVKKDCERLLKDFPTSSYAQYARFALARMATSNDRELLPEEATREQRMSAVALLSDIDCHAFAYGAEALILKRLILQQRGGASAREAEKVAKQLDEGFPDAYSRIQDLARRLPEREWNELNPRAPRPIKNARHDDSETGKP